MSLFAELKRRNVFRVGIGYAIVGWLVLQVADLVLENIAAPAWVMQSIMLLVAIGFPLVLVFAWAFELTPDGLKRDAEVDHTQSIAGQTGRKLDRSIIAVLVIAVAYFVWERQAVEPAAVDEPNTSAQAEAVLDKSIAVMPFVNMSADADNEYFSDGLSEELLNLLAKVDGLKVAARTSSFKFKNSEADISDIGQQLNVATVLEGSVRKAGNEVRITAQLIKVDDGFHLWSETYDRSLDNIFQVQGEIAQHIVDALKLPLLGEDEQPLAPRATANVEAYDLYLLARHQMRTPNADSINRAVDHLTRATALDPDFAPAWAGLANAYLLKADYAGMETQAALEIAEKATERALSIDPRDPDALLSKAWQLNLQDRSEAAAQITEEVLRINPNHSDAMTALANHVWIYDSERASRLVREAYRLDPLDPGTRMALVNQLNFEDRLDEAEQRIQEFLLEDPDNPDYYEVWGGILESRRQFVRAVPKMEMAFQLRPGDAFPATALVGIYLQLGDLDSARKWAEYGAERAPDARHTRYAQNLLHQYRGEWESLESAYAKAFEDAPAESREDAGFMYWVGDLAMRQGDPERAEAIFREVLEMNGFEPPRITNPNASRPIVALINILPEGAERDELIASLSAYQAQMEEHYGWWFAPYLLKAYLETFAGDRDGVMAALSAAIDRGYSSYRWIELNLVLSRWKNDPLFQEQLQRMRQIADDQLAELEAES